MKAEKVNWELLESRIIRKDGCWEWNGYHDKTTGYARLGCDWVHRLVYERYVGEIPEKYQIDHLCRNRGCINPAHLEAVTQRVNILRGASVSAIHAAKTHCVHGHPLTAGNLKFFRTRPGKRVCLICHRATRQRIYQRSKGRVA